MINFLALLLLYLLRIRFYLIRRFKIGYSRKDLVLDIGSGNDPHPRADILLDSKSSDDIDRPFKLLKDKRPFVVADIEALPFKDKTIDFIICSHVLEHIEDPSKALDEMVRVGKRGYIETPSIYAQKLCDVPAHKWFVKKQENVLFFIRKQNPFFDAELNELFFKLGNARDIYYQIWFYMFKEGIINYRWNDSIKYKIFNLPDLEINHEAFKKGILAASKIAKPADRGFRLYIKRLIKYYYSVTTLREQKLKNLSKR